GSRAAGSRARATWSAARMRSATSSAASASMKAWRRPFEVLVRQRRFAYLPTAGSGWLFPISKSRSATGPLSFLLPRKSAQREVVPRGADRSGRGFARVHELLREPVEDRREESQVAPLERALHDGVEEAERALLPGRLDVEREPVEDEVEELEELRVGRLRLD